jgi:hypothetical protein
MLMSAGEIVWSMKPWGLHEFTAADPDGNLFRVFYDFGTPGRAKDAGALGRLQVEVV